MTGLVKTLIDCGALPRLNTGPSNPRPRDEAKLILTDQQRIANIRRRELVREAVERGEPIPVFKLGRPRKHTPEEALAAKRLQKREARIKYLHRVKEGITTLADLHARSNDDANFLASN